MDVTPAEITLVRGGLCAGVATGAEQDLQSLAVPPRHDKMIKYHYQYATKCAVELGNPRPQCVLYIHDAYRNFSDPSRLKTRRNGHRDRGCVRTPRICRLLSQLCVTIVIMGRVRASKRSKRSSTIAAHALVAVSEKKRNNS